MAAGLFLAQGFICISLAAAILMAFSIRDRSALYWSTGAALIGIASILGALGGTNDPFIYGFLISGTAFLSFITSALGIECLVVGHKETRNKLTLWLIFAIIFSVVLTIAHQTQPIHIQAALYAFGVFLAAAWSAIALFRFSKALHDLLIRLIAWSLALQVFILFLRLIESLTTPVARVAESSGFVLGITLAWVTVTVFKTVLYISYRFKSASYQRDAAQERLFASDIAIISESHKGGITTMSSFAGMIVHELRDFIQVFKLNLQRLELQTESSQKTTKNSLALSNQAAPLRHIHQSLNDLSSLTESLTSLLKSGDSLKTQVNVPSLLERIRPILEADSKTSNYSFTIQCFCTQQPYVLVHEGMLLRMILSVVRNSVEAFKGSYALAIHLSCREETFDNKRHLAIIVSDNGIGYPVDLMGQQRYSKESLPKSEAGMGLFLANKLAESWGGHIALGTNDDEMSRGAKTMIYLPVAAQG